MSKLHQIVVNRDSSSGLDAYDVMICDPPYSAHVHTKAISSSGKRGTRVRDLGFDSLSEDFRQSLAAQVAKARRWALIFSDIEGLHAWREACTRAGAKYIRPVPWVRWSMPQLSGDRPPSGCEFVTCFWGAEKGKKSWRGPGNLTHLDHKCLRGEHKHKAEKPLDLCLDLVDWFSEPGELVWDPCAGSGTVGLACKLLGRGYIGAEINPEWAEKANARIAANNLSARDEERLERWRQRSKERADKA